MLEDANAPADAGGASDAAAIETPVAAALEAPARSIRDDMLAIASKYNPERGEGGKFSPRGDIAADDAPVGAAPAAEKTTDQPRAGALETATPSIEPPSSWSAEVKAKWAALPPDVQQYVAQRESEAHKAITQAGERLKGYEVLDQTIGAHRKTLRAAYGSDAAAVQQLAAMHQYATQDPAGFLKWFAQDRRIDLTQLYQAGQQAQPDPVATLAQRQAAIEQRMEMERATTAIEREIERFKGNAPHFADLEQTMVDIMPAVLAKAAPNAAPADLLKAAYEQAQWLNEGVRAKLLSEQEAERKAKAEAEAGRAAKEAKRAASVNVRSNPAGSPSQARPQSMRDTMEAIARQAFGQG